MSDQTSTTIDKGIRIGRSATVHMVSKFGNVVCNADGNNPGQRKITVEAPVTCKSCAKRAESAARRGFTV